MEKGGGGGDEKKSRLITRLAIWLHCLKKKSSLLKGSVRKCLNSADIIYNSKQRLS